MSRMYTLAAISLFTAAPLFAQVAGEAPNSTTTGDRATSPFVSVMANEEIVPASARTVMGGSSNSIPWSWTPIHFMQTFLGSELPQSGYPIRCIGFRSNNRTDTGATIDLEIWLGYTTYDQATMVSTYASNYNTTTKPILVYKRKMVKLDDMIANTNPGFFQYQIPLDTPFIWVPQKGRNLVFECKIHGNSNNNASFSFFPDNESGTGTTTSRLYSSNAANALTGTIGRNYGPVLRFDVKCKANADAVDYGSGSTNKQVLGNVKIDVGPFNYTYSAAAGTRGFWFQSPVAFTINGLRVPDETKHGKHNVAVYVMKTKVVSLVPVFFSAGTSSALVIPCKIPIAKGDFVCILGCAGDATRQHNSYSTGGRSTKILGQTAQLERAWTNTNMITLKGTGAWNYSTGVFGRVDVMLTGPVTPSQTTAGRPLLGQNASLDIKSGFTAQVGVLVMAAGRLPATKTPFGNFLVTAPLILIAVPNANAVATFPIPSTASLLGKKVTWQSFAFDLKGSIYGASNGTEWLLGEQ